MTLLYSFCAIATIILCTCSYIIDVKKSLCQNLMMVIMVFSNLGYLALQLSTELNEALLAMKIIYLGGCFIPMLYFLTVCGICHVFVRKRYILPMIALQGGIFCAVCTIGYLPWFYKNVSLVHQNGLTTLAKEYGPMHILYPITMTIYFTASLAMIIWCIIKKSSVNNLELQYMIAFAGVTVVGYFATRLAHLPYDIMPFSYLLLMIGALIPIYHSNLFTVQENMDVIREQLSHVAFITFDQKMQYMGANRFARSIFPELQGLNVGHPLTHVSDELGTMIADLQQFRKEMHPESSREHIHQKYKTIKIGDSYYDTMIHTIHNVTHHCVGYTVELTDETDHHRVLELTERYNEQLFDQVENKTQRIRDIQEKTILGMAQMVESRDLSTGGHIKRTSDVVKIFSKKIMESDYKISSRFLGLVARSAPMHDLGKIGVDDAILRKQGLFTDEEYEEMKKHAAIGGKMVTDILTDVEEESVVRIARNVANYHHEKYDGSGYPEGLVGAKIPVEARIMALADVFDALVSKRCYKEAYSFDQAFEIIEKEAGTHFDYTLAMIFLQCRPELEAYYTQNNESQ